MAPEGASRSAHALSLARRMIDVNTRRMQHLEEQIAHLTRLLDELNEVVTTQQGELDRLTRQVRILLEREAEREAQGSGGVIIGDERPPHY